MEGLVNTIRRFWEGGVGAVLFDLKGLLEISYMLRWTPVGDIGSALRFFFSSCFSFCGFSPFTRLDLQLHSQKYSQQYGEIGKLGLT